MSLIKCPECGKEINTQSTACVGCGFPIHDYLIKKSDDEHKAEIEREKIKCSRCGFQNNIGSSFCAKCGNSLNDYDPYKENTAVSREVKQKDPFNGVYRYTLFGELEVYCPRCGSDNCSHYQEQKIIPEKTKTIYTANLNPLHPFTLVNKKEKVKRKEKIVTESKFICNSCGKIFN